jgi:Rab GDP dissociation inhibitor
MDEEYDAIVLGTGLKECILSGLLSVAGKKILHMDHNNYYGGESASLNLVQMFDKFAGGQAPPANLGSSRDYNIDLVPKFIIANGLLVKMLVHTNVRRYMDFKVIDGSYVYREGKIYKVPATDSEALSSSIMGFFEKRRARNFFVYMQEYDEANPKTWKKMDINSTPMQAIYEEFGLEDGTIDFIGHALALHRDDGYKQRPAKETFERIKLYADSMARFGKSPYIYPLFGLGELPQGFARLSAIYGGTYMLNKPFLGVEMGDDGKVVGVKSMDDENENEAVARAPIVIADPSYFPDKVTCTQRVVRSICILKGPAPHTDDNKAVQIILPGNQVNGRANDIYVVVLDHSFNVAPNGFFVGIVSTTIETDTPDTEIIPGLDALGGRKENILCRFNNICDVMTPTDPSAADNIHVTPGYDATSHFETTCLDVLEVYKSVMGEELDLTTLQPSLEEDE